MNPIDQQQISATMYQVLLLAKKLGAAPLNKLPGCWEHRIDEQWWVAVNGHPEPCKCSKNAEVNPYECYIEFNGWPAGSMNSFGGIIAAGELANERTFVAALEKAMASTTAP